MSVDEESGLVFLPTASASPDFYGGTRPGDNRYANSVVALRGATGEVVWHFQIVHHDVWDLDLPAQPILVDVQRDGRPPGRFGFGGLVGRRIGRRAAGVTSDQAARVAVLVPPAGQSPARSAGEDPCQGGERRCRRACLLRCDRTPALPFRRNACGPSSACRTSTVCTM